MHTSSPLANTETHQEAFPEQRPAPSVLMYMAGLVVTLCGLYAVNVVIEDPGFANLTYGLTVIGTLVSYISRKQSASPRAIETPAVIFCVFVFLLAMLADPALPFLAPASVEGDRAKALAVLLVWLAVFRSFTLLSDGALLFCCVPTIAMIGLVSTMSSNGALVKAFVVFIGAAAFLLVHENFIRTRTSSRYANKMSDERGMLLSQVQLAAICGIGAMMLANIVTPSISTVGSWMQVNPGTASSSNPSRQNNTRQRVTITEVPQVRVGTGPVTLSDQMVMRVQSIIGTYWRGATFDYYTGSGWNNTLRDRVPLEVKTTSRGANNLFADPQRSNSAAYKVSIPSTESTQVGLHSQRLTQQVTLFSSGLFHEIYAAAEPREVVLFTYAEPNVDGSGAIHLDKALTSTTYIVESEVPNASPEVLQKAPLSYPPYIRDKYLQLPDTPAIARIRGLAQEVTAGRKTTYDKVKALEEWVGNHCKYNLNAAAIPSNQDVVEYFLFTSQEGYCDSFATALAVMCRAIGIPARVASGFAAGELDATNQEYVVRERDKHQWTEVFFPHVGWIAFDSTSYAEDITDRSGAAKKRDVKSLLNLLFGRGLLPPLLLAALLCMIGYVLKVEWWDRRRRKFLLATLPLPQTNRAIVEAYEVGCALLARRGLPRPASATPAEYLTQAALRLAAFPDAIAALERITTLVVRYRYSKDTANGEDVRLAQEAILALRHALQTAPRRLPLPALSSGGE
jgi:transglutaminase-like putative cysteine protease